MELPSQDRIGAFADMFAAMGSEARLRIMQLLLAAHPAGMVVGEIQAELGLSASNLSHHLDKLKHEGLVAVQREGTFLRCRADVESLRQLLAFLYAECCTRSKAVSPAGITKCG
jgi:ArsR family transcriptional regulator